MSTNLFKCLPLGAGAMVALLATSALPAAHAAEPAFAIRNVLRPGAKAPHCPAADDTPDGCTFHTMTDTVNRARLAITPGTHWIARTPDAALVSIRPAADETATNGTRYQVIDIVPIQPDDADIVVTFDRLTDGPAPVQVVERRRVSMMKHGVKSWSEP